MWKVLIFICVCQHINTQRINRIHRINNDDDQPLPFELEEDSADESLNCPKRWVGFDEHCYKFVRSPKKDRSDAMLHCQAFQASLMSLNSMEEHMFIVSQLRKKDPQHNKWYISTRDDGNNRWVNDGDDTTIPSMDEAFIKKKDYGYGEDYESQYYEHLVYSYDNETDFWGLLRVDDLVHRLFICEIPYSKLDHSSLSMEERGIDYGQDVSDPEKVLRGPYFVKQPDSVVFDLSKRSVKNFISMKCLAAGYPPPTYRWYKEEYFQDKLQSVLIDPLSEDDETKRFTTSGGSLIISNPNQMTDRGNYHCTATNKFGTIMSETVELSFGHIGEFNLKRSNEKGNQNWGKAIYCDPPQHYPEVRYYWVRNYFPNFVEEDQRVFVSFDGNLYFSALENIDRGRYSCNVQSPVSKGGKNGPFFNLDVVPHPNYQQLKFPNNFPKIFPEAPIVGEEVRMECVAFGYPVPSYNWTRRGAPLPRGASFSSYNRILVLPELKVEDQGEYICRAYNTKTSIQNSVMLSVQAKPVFIIPLEPKLVDTDSNVMWTCESFGIPDVQYQWYKDGIWLNPKTINSTHPRYEVQDNVLKIRHINEKQDEGMYQCKATNQLATTFSAAELRVLKLPPSFVKHPLEPEIYAALGGNVTIKCNPESAPRAEITWKKDGLRIGNGGMSSRRYILPNGNLFIRKVSRDDSGVYTCIATNEYGTDSSQGRLIALHGPELKRRPEREVYARVGSSIRLFCQAEADRMLDVAYYWLHNGIRLRERNKHLRDHLESKWDQDRSYSVHSAAEQQWERDQQRWMEYHRWYNYERGPAYRTERPTYEGELIWGAREHSWDSDFFWNERFMSRFVFSENSGDLEIHNVSVRDAGIYHCIVKSSVSTLKAKTTIYVSGPPGPPGGVQVLDRNQTSARLQWADGATNGHDITMYTIEGRTNWNDTWRIISENVSAVLIDTAQSRRELLLLNVLSPWCIYEFRVRAYNTLGYSINSEPSPQYATYIDRPYRAPYNIGGGGGHVGDLTLTWDPLPGEDQNAPGIYYEVQWRRVEFDPQNEYTNASLAGKGNVGMSVQRIKRDYFYSRYNITVRACNERGCGPHSEEAMIYSAEDMPQVIPDQVGARPYNATSLRVLWKPIKYSRETMKGKLIGHRIKYWRQDNKESDALYYLSRGNSSTALILGLLPNTYYYVKVMVYNSAGAGPESEKYLERTFKLQPQKPPTSVLVEPYDPNTIRVTWRYVAPSIREEPLDGYKVRIWEAGQDIKTANDTIVKLGERLEAYVTGLELGKIYKLRVLAFSLGGDGKMSSPPWEFQMGGTSELVADSVCILPYFMMVFILSLLTSVLPRVM